MIKPTYKEYPITFENLPTAVAELKEMMIWLLLQNNNAHQPEADRWLDIKELCVYLPDKPSVKTVYGWKSKNLIKYHKPGKKLAFLKSEIDQWIKTDRGKVVLASSNEDDNYLKPQKKRNKIRK